jgi:hypothetical protein
MLKEKQDRKLDCDGTNIDISKKVHGSSHLNYQYIMAQGIVESRSVVRSELAACCTFVQMID